MTQTTPEPESNPGSGPGQALPPGLARPAQRALAAAGIGRLEQFTEFTEAEVLKLHGMGPKAMAEIRRALEENGVSFLDTPKE